MAAGGVSSFLRRAGAIPWSSIAGEALDRVLLVAKTVCFVHVFNTYVCSIALVRGPSMLPTINITGDVVAVERISPRRGLIAAGDVVLLRSPENPMKIVTKRVLALEGDTVSFLLDPANGVVSRTVLVPKGHVWVQGDNMYESRDSRQFGPVPYGLIQGRAFYRDYDDVFPKKIPYGLPPIRGIEHQIDFVLRASIRNRSAYKSNPEETKEPQKQVEELMEKGYVRESMCCTSHSSTKE